MAQQIPKFRGGQPLSQQITATSLNRIVDELNSLKIVNVIGGTFKKLPNGTSLHIPWTGGGGGGSSPTPSTCTLGASIETRESEDDPPIISHWLSLSAGLIGNAPAVWEGGDASGLSVTTPVVMTSFGDAVWNVYAHIVFDDVAGSFSSYGVVVSTDAVPDNTLTDYYLSMARVTKTVVSTTTTFSVANFGCGSIQTTACRNWFAAESPFYGVTIVRE